MTAFKHLALIKAHPLYNIPFSQDISDLTELCYLTAAVRNITERVSIPVSPDASAPLEDFDRYLIRNRPDLVGISTMTGSYSNALRLAEKAKRAGAYVVMGGYHPSALTEEVLSSPWVDPSQRCWKKLLLILHNVTPSVFPFRARSRLFSSSRLIGINWLLK